MHRLAEIQRRFAASIRGRDDDAADLIAGDGVAAHLRFAIHRNNTYASLVEVLAGAFPRAAALFDDGLFYDAAVEYIAEQPPSRAQLAYYGESFPAFVEGYTPARHYPWLADLARLEWARHEAFFARDVAALTAADLSAIAPAQYGGLRLRLHPAVRLIESGYPIDTLWKADTRAESAPPRSTYVVVARPERAVLHFVSDAADLAFLRAASAGQTLDEAAAAAFDIDCEHDLPAALARHLQFGVFSIDTIEST